MSETVSQEMTIVSAVASLPLPPMKEMGSRLKTLVKQVTDGRDSVSKNAAALARARMEEKEGNLITNWWNNRGDAVKDAQLDLSKSIGHLTSSTSELLLINTAISKVLNDQQIILLDQQHKLEDQAEHIRIQNNQILRQQKIQEKQQEAIIAANRGIMEAKGITNEQAAKLVGCVELTLEARRAMEEANRKLHDQFETSLAELNVSLSTKLKAHHDDVILPIHDRHNALSEEFRKTQAEFAGFVEMTLESRGVMEEANRKLHDHVQTSLAELNTALSTKLKAQHDEIVLPIHERQNVLTDEFQKAQAELVALASTIAAELTERTALAQGLHAKIDATNRQLRRVALAIAVGGVILIASLVWQLVGWVHAH